MFKKRSIVEDDRGNAFEVLNDHGGLHVEVQSVVTKERFSAPRDQITLVEGATPR